VQVSSSSPPYVNPPGHVPVKQRSAAVAASTVSATMSTLSPAATLNTHESMTLGLQVVRSSLRGDVWYGGEPTTVTGILIT